MALPVTLNVGTLRWSVKVGDLVKDKEYDDAASYGVIIRIGDLRTKNPYHILCFRGGVLSKFPKDYVQNHCEVINESR